MEKSDESDKYNIFQGKIKNMANAMFFYFIYLIISLQRQMVTNP